MTRRVALVTGAGRGIGRAIALELASRGNAVAVADIAPDSADETTELIADRTGGEAVAVEVDVTSGASVQHAVDVTAAKLGPVEILVNNAGWDEAMPFVDSDEPFWERVVQINYLGVVRFVGATLPTMLEAGWGRIVNIGSDAARVGSSQEAVYSGAKGAVISFTKTIAREAAASGVTANAVCPGPTMTPLIEENLRTTENAERLLKSLQRAIPMRRLGAPEDIANAVAFFASEASGFVTGQTLSVSGGLTMA